MPIRMLISKCFTTMILGHFYPDDTLFISLFNGTQTIDILKIHKDNVWPSLWFPYSIPVNGLIPMTSTMQLIVRISDYNATVNICEAGFDHFSVTDFSMSKVDEAFKTAVEIYPNPFGDQLSIKGIETGTIEIFDLSGRLVYQNEVLAEQNLAFLESGVYVIVIKDNSGNIVELAKQIKQ